jgi:hypothetical protein
VADGLAHPVVVGSEPAAGQAAGGVDGHIGAGHLLGELRETSRNVLTMRYQYQADHCSNLRGYCT